jgi:hypothetical protein
MFRSMPAQEPGVPQSVGGLHADKSRARIMYPGWTYTYCTISGLKEDVDTLVTQTVDGLTVRRRSQTFASMARLVTVHRWHYKNDLLEYLHGTLLGAPW